MLGVRVRVRVRVTVLGGAGYGAARNDVDGAYTSSTSTNA